jgi:acetyl-CoA carboxylase carboxyltransferase component
MDIIETSIDTASEEYKENYRVMEALAADLRKELEIAWNKRSEKARARMAEQNKLPVRKRLELLLDRNTPFLEIAPLAAPKDGRVVRVLTTLNAKVAPGDRLVEIQEEGEPHE